MEGFIQEQANDVEPIQFLKIWAAHQKHKMEILNQKTRVSDIQINLKVEGKPIITSDQPI